MTARKPLERYQTPGEAAKALQPHTQDERQARSAAPTRLDRSAAPRPKSPTVAEAPAQTILPPEKALASEEPGDEPEQRRNLPAAVWMGLVGAVALGAVALL